MKVFLNPGHAPGGVPDPGACNPVTGLRESDVAAKIGALIKKYLEAAGCTGDMSAADICGALVAQKSQSSFDGLTGTSMTWNSEGQVSKAPTAYVIKDGAYVLPEA